MFLYTSIFIIGGLCGWMLDTAYRTWDDGRYAPGTWISFFSIIYGVAAILLYVFFAFLPISIFPDVIVGTFLVICLELLSGVLALLFLNRRFWDYRANSYNFYGFIDAKHSFYWLVLVGLYRIVFMYI